MYIRRKLGCTVTSWVVVQGKVVYSNNINVYMFYNHIMISVYYHKEAGLDCLHLYTSWSLVCGGEIVHKYMAAVIFLMFL